MQSFDQIPLCLSIDTSYHFIPLSMTLKLNLAEGQEVSGSQNLLDSFPHLLPEFVCLLVA